MVYAINKINGVNKDNINKVKGNALSYTLEQGEIVPNGDIVSEWAVIPSGSHWSTIDEPYGSPDIEDYVSINVWGKNEKYDMTTLELNGLGKIYEIKLWFYLKCAFQPAQLLRVTTSWDSNQRMPMYSTVYQWKAEIYSSLNKYQSDLDSLWVNIFYNGDGSGLTTIATMYAIIKYYGACTIKINGVA